MSSPPPHDCPRTFRSLGLCSETTWALAAILTFSFAPIGNANEPADSVEFFENRIRPVLVKHCYECHAADAEDIGGSLLLDSSDAMMQGGDSGPAITPGNKETSLLISAIRYESSEMPPQGKLPENVIKDFEDWIAAGAKDPRPMDAAKDGHSQKKISQSTERFDIERGRRFWAFRPLAFTLPSGVDADVAGDARGIIDQFLSERLRDADIVARGIADPGIRLRRLAFDLTGLPPSIELQERWNADPSWSNWQRIVDELLASPAFAEHWARHWMDVARFADSNGSDFNATFHEAWRYRDYLIRSLAADRPFDHMVRQQIAGDQLLAASDVERHDNIVATTFLMLGTKMLSERDKAKLELDVVDEQIDTIGRAFMAMTLGCARCHDHKFDPIPMEDYYALAGIFKSTISLRGESQQYVSTWSRVPLPASDAQRDAVRHQVERVSQLKAEISAAEKSLADVKSGVVDELPGVVVDDAKAIQSGRWRASTYTRGFVASGYVHDDNTDKGRARIRFTAELPSDGEYEVRIAYSPGTNRATNVPVEIEAADGKQMLTLNQQNSGTHQSSSPTTWFTLGTFRFAAAAPAAVTLSNAGTDGYVIADAVQFLAREEVETVSETLDSAQAIAKRERIVTVQKQIDALTKTLKQVEADAPPPLPVAMAPTDRPTDEISDSPLYIRGEAGNPGKSVPRGFLQVCSSGPAQIENARGSGRLDLADWLTDPDHPLVARVYVNRVWMHLMGEGLVRTVDNFGERGERPSHPELLDYLASDFVRNGWHLKPLIRQIVTSSAYSRSGEYDAASAQADPENRLWWRMHRRRLPAEAIRDTMLSVAAVLDPRPMTETMKGHGVLVSGNDGNSKAGKLLGIDAPYRSIYLPIVRGYISPVMTALDAADPDLLVGRRPTTNVPGQALVLINSPEVNDWARATASRVLKQDGDFESKLRFTYRLCLQRQPREADRELASEFFAYDRESLDVWHQWVAAMFAGTEFRLLD